MSILIKKALHLKLFYMFYFIHMLCGETYSKYKVFSLKQMVDACLKFDLKCNLRDVMTI